MAVTKHPLGNFRAYKKVNGEVYQTYHHTHYEAAIKQAEYEKIAESAIRTKTKKLFNANGRFIGFSVLLRNRKGRKSKIVIQKQVTVDGIVRREQFSHITTELSISWMVEKFIEVHNLDSDALIELSIQIKRAKSLYMSDIYFNLEKMKLGQ